MASVRMNMKAACAAVVFAGGLGTCAVSLGGCQRESPPAQPQGSGNLAPGQKGELTVVRQIEGKTLPRPIPIPIGAELLSTNTGAKDGRPDDFFIRILVPDATAAVAFYNGVFWDRLRDGAHRDYLPSRPGSASDPLPIDLQPGEDFLVYVNLPNGLTVLLHAMGLQPGDTDYRPDKPFKLIILFGPPIDAPG